MLMQPVSSPCRKMAIFSNISVHSSLMSDSAGSTASSAVSTPPSPANKHLSSGHPGRSAHQLHTATGGGDNYMFNEEGFKTSQAASS